MNDLKGLTTQQANERLQKYGKNELVPEKKQSFVFKLLDVLKEPMFILLIAASLIYFLLGEPRDGAIMLVFVVFVIGIDVVQEWKTDKTLKALRDLSSPQVTVRRDNNEILIDSRLLVPGDIMLITEGEKIPADSRILVLNDLCIDESSLTGEAEVVRKVLKDESEDHWHKDLCYAGTVVTQGSATVEVLKTGAQTEYGKIGMNVAMAPEGKSPLQKQTASLVKFSALFGAALFILVCLATWQNLPDHGLKDRLVESVLSGVTLAMAMIPEEFPVILTVFLSMGAWRLARKHSLIRKLPSVETLGAVSVLCVDKTGTLTKNQMEVRGHYAPQDEKQFLQTMGMACEVNPYDPMEKAMIAFCGQSGIPEEQLFCGSLIHEYTFTSETKRMGHVWKMPDGTTFIAAKGSPETMLPLCNLSISETELIAAKQRELAQNGYRVIAVAGCKVAEDAVPQDLQQAALTFYGLCGLADPPREAVPEAIRQCSKAGIRVVMITGDNGLTASAIANQIGLDHAGGVITGAELDAMSDEELKKRLPDVSVFARVIPEHKMRIVKCFRELGRIVGMTGDGVNDAPALKYADIGIAMGRRGTEVAREASDMVLMDDNFTTIVDTVRDGRRIYDNIRKAIIYVLVIHIPIALSALLAPLMGISAAAIMLLPLHVVLLELIIDPTCSIVFERQPAENDIMDRKPRDPRKPLVTAGVLIRSILQGLAIFAGAFCTYYFTLSQTSNPQLARSMGLAILVLSNLLLVYVNSSDNRPAIVSFVKNIRDWVLGAINGGILLMLLLVLYTPLSKVLQLNPLSLSQLAACLGISAAAVLWFELVKLIRYLARKPQK